MLCAYMCKHIYNTYAYVCLCKERGGREEGRERERDVLSSMKCRIDFLCFIP